MHLESHGGLLYDDPNYDGPAASRTELELIPYSLAPTSISCASSTNTGTQAVRFSGLRRLPKIQNMQTSTNTYRLSPAITDCDLPPYGGTTDKLYAEDDSIHYAKTSNTSAILVVLSDSAHTILMSSSIATPKDTMLTFMSARCIIIHYIESCICQTIGITAFAAIQAIPTPIIAIKVLAAGRNEPREAFRLALENIKPTDAMAVGMYTQFQPDQIRQNALTVAKLLSE